MAKTKDDIEYATSQARLNEEEAVRVAYKHDTPLEGGKIADSEPIDLFSSAHNIERAVNSDQDQNEDPTTQPQLHHHPTNTDDEQGAGGYSNGKSAKFPSKNPPSLATK